MKQKKLGKKVQNWHRPLGRSQLSRRFLQHRFDDPEVTKRGRSLGCIVEVDECWDCYDPYVDYWTVGTDDLSRHELDLFLKQLLHPSPPLFRDEWATDAAAEGKPETTLAAAACRPAASTNIEKRLSDHIEIARHFSNNSAAFRYSIVDAIGDVGNLEVVRHVGAGFRNPELARRICLFAPFWVRSPLTWTRTGETSFLDHLFVLHEVPGFLYRDWFRKSDSLRVKWLCWFILFGQGGSLKRAAELFGWKIPPRFQQHLFDAPSHAYPVDACLFAEVKRLGGSETDCRRVLRNPAFVIDPTEFSDSTAHLSFWHETVRWLIAHREAITDDESDLILSWAMHEYTEAEYARALPFSWKGRRAATVLARSIQYRNALENPWSWYQWQGHGWNWNLDESPAGTWSYVELTSSELLYHEGQSMKHCVSSYAGRCTSGYSAIISMRHNDLRHLTVEINPRTRQVVQAKGPCNRQADTEEQLLPGPPRARAVGVVIRIPCRDATAIFLKSRLWAKSQLWQR